VKFTCTFKIDMYNMSFKIFHNRYHLSIFKTKQKNFSPLILGATKKCSMTINRTPLILIAIVNSQLKVKYYYFPNLILTAKSSRSRDMSLNFNANAIEISNWNISANINPIFMIQKPLDSPTWDESNEPLTICL